MILGEPLENLLLRMPHGQMRHTLRQGGRGVSAHDPQLPFQRREGLLPILARFLEGFAGKAAQLDRSESGADPATVVCLFLLPAVFLLLVGESLRQAFGVFGLQTIEDRLQGPAAYLPQKSLQLLLELERGLRRATLREKRRHRLCHLLADFLPNAPKFFVDFLEFRGNQRCQQQAEQIRILHGRRPFLENRVVVFTVSREKRLPFQYHLAA